MLSKSSLLLIAAAASYSIFRQRGRQAGKQELYTFMHPMKSIFLAIISSACSADATSLPPMDFYRAIKEWILITTEKLLISWANNGCDADKILISALRFRQDILQFYATALLLMPPHVIFGI